MNSSIAGQMLETAEDIHADPELESEIDIDTVTTNSPEISIKEFDTMFRSILESAMSSEHSVATPEP